jgi:cellulose synthase/poly-beta-1,6-N-acetylglucosamine synthase-like glycosyltransferase
MSFPAAPLLLALYYLVLGILAFYGVHRFVLVVRFLRTRDRAPVRPAEPAEWPVVTVQLPLYNEMYVAERLLAAVARLDYPREKLEVQVLDDSTDETSEIVARLVEGHRRAGLDVHHLRRADRTGFKAGALAAGLARARGRFLAVFDADFVPRPDFLKEAVPHFAEPAVGMVQGSWSHINRGYSPLTRVEAILLDGHFLVEHTARHRSGCFFNFNGTAGIWRREAIETAGGWQHDTLTEDLDLSYRAQLAGWKFVYLPELAVPSELPVDVAGFKSQQHRWAQGAVQTGRKLLPRILGSRLPWKVRLEALVHLTNNVSYPLMLVLAALMFPAMVLRRGSPVPVLLLVDLPLFLAATLSVLLFYTVSQRAAGAGGRRELRWLPAVLGLGIGLSVNNARAVVSGLVRRGGVFHRTPKYRIELPGQDWRLLRYRVANPTLAVETLLAVYFAGCIAWAALDGMWASIPFLWLFFHGYAWMVGMSLAPALGRLRLRPGRAAAGAAGAG